MKNSYREVYDACNIIMKELQPSLIEYEDPLKIINATIFNSIQIIAVHMFFDLPIKNQEALTIVKNGAQQLRTNGWIVPTTEE